MKYWIERFPRLLSHSYHALQSCCNEPIFSYYYPISYAFSSPNYFYEETDDFKPFDNGSKARDSPKRYNHREYQYKPMNYPNFVMNRKSVPKVQNNGLMTIGDGNLSNNYNRSNKKGSYNFQRIWNNFKPAGSGDNYRYTDKPILRDNFDAFKENTNVVDRSVNEENNEIPVIGNEKNVFNAWNPESKKDESISSIESEKKAERSENKKTDHQNQAKKEQEKHSSNGKKKTKAEPAAANKETQIDDDGFTKVRYKGHSNPKKQQKSADHQNENVKWIVPGRENKEQK